MKKMSSLELYTKKSGSDYLTELVPGNVFLSFHTPSDDCVGVLILRNEMTNENLETLFNLIQEYFKSDAKSNDIKSNDVKIVGSLNSISFIESFLLKKECHNIKKIEKSAKVDIAFLARINKVRVSIEMQTDSLHKSRKLKVLIVDDSKTIRNILNRVFSSDDMFEVCGMAEKPSDVEALIIKNKPDLITLDIHMPEMDGVTLLKIIAPKFKIPTIMISSISMAEGPLVLEALEHGAIDYIQKPEISELEKVTPMILEKARIAATSNNKKSFSREKKTVKTKEMCQLDSLVVIGSSTGGTEALREILTSLPDVIPPILIVQHIPAVFSAAFAKRMNDLCRFEVKEATDGDELLANRVLIAPGGMQMRMIQKNNKTFVEITDDEPVNRFKPSVDYLFHSVAKSFYTNTIAVILTGMGKDGAKGMLELKRLGAHTIAQDEATSIVFGMPKEAINIGAANFVEPLSQIAEKIAILTNKQNLKKAGNA